MAFRTRAGWLLVHVLPLMAIPQLARAGASLSAGARATLCYVALMSILVAGQSQTVRHRRWAMFTALGLTAAWAAGGALITLLDPLLHLPEPIIVPIAHFGCGLVLGGVQSLALPARRGRFALTSGIAWLAASAIAFPLWRADWLPGDVRGLFPGAAEMTT